MLHFLTGQGVFSMKRRRNTDRPHFGQAIMKLPMLPTESQVNAKGITISIMLRKDQPNDVNISGTPHMIIGMAMTMPIIKRWPRL
ncbi:MAG: hypothetical protein EOO82_00980 [Oxalobacteraceae bacterium]|nr:MAG: hypothetical protein EOO82_00980 [Oxalobacteraceae bacterium]